MRAPRGSPAPYTRYTSKRTPGCAANSHSCSDSSKTFLLSDVAVFTSYFEIYGGKVFDLLQGRNQLRVMEDGDNAIQIHGLNEVGCEDAEDVLRNITAGNSLRASGVTSANEQSSRSHAILQAPSVNRRCEQHV